MPTQMDTIETNAIQAATRPHTMMSPHNHIFLTFDTGEKAGGGFNPVSETNPAGSVLVYVSTDDIDATLAKAKSLGAKIFLPKTEIPDTGWFGIFSDPTGNMVALYTPLQKET